MIGLVSQWMVSSKSSMSDHIIVKFALKIDVKQLPLSYSKKHRLGYLSEYAEAKHK